MIKNDKCKLATPRFSAYALRSVSKESGILAFVQQA